MNSSTASSKTRRGGRGSRRELRAAISDEMLPALKRRLPLTEPMDQEQIEKIDAASMDILENVGVIFRDRPSTTSCWD